MTTPLRALSQAQRREVEEVVGAVLARGGARFSVDECNRLITAAVRYARKLDAAERERALWQLSPEALTLLAALGEQLSADRDNHEPKAA